MTLLRSSVTRVAGALGALAALGLLALMLLTVADVVRRALTDQSINGVIEVSPIILLGAVVLGLGQGEVTGTHVRTTLVTDRLKPRVRSAVRLVAYAFCIYLLFWMAWLSAERAIEAYELGDSTPGFTSIATWPGRALVPVGFVLFALGLLIKALDDLRALRARNAEPESQEARS